MVKTVVARRPLHKVAHAPCPYGATSWSACDEGSKEAFGKCSALVVPKRYNGQKANECTKWATDEIGDRRYCNQHAASIVEAEVKAHREEKRKAELDARIEAHLAWIAEHPSVWDNKRDGGAGAAPPVVPLVPDRSEGRDTSSAAGLVIDGADGESNPVSPEGAEPGTKAVSAGAGGPAVPRGPILWSASSGSPVNPRRSS